MRLRATSQPPKFIKAVGVPRPEILSPAVPRRKPKAAPGKVRSETKA
jgi:hypothetical protein